MTGLTRVTMATVILAAIFCCFPLAAQVSSTSSGTVHTSWGYYGWQADYGGVTTAFMSEVGFAKRAGTVQIPVSIPTDVTIEEVHGDVSFTIWPASGCSKGSVIAQVRDQEGNVLATVDLVGRAPGNITIPISAKFGKPLHITSLQLQTFTEQCGALTLSWALVMS
jgi:hypothetical protein